MPRIATAQRSPGPFFRYVGPQTENFFWAIPPLPKSSLVVHIFTLGLALCGCSTLLSASSRKSASSLGHRLRNVAASLIGVRGGESASSLPAPAMARFGGLNMASLWHSMNAFALGRVRPNPSFKPSPNSVARQPSSAGPAAHFALAVQRATLSVPA